MKYLAVALRASAFRAACAWPAAPNLNVDAGARRTKRAAPVAGLTLTLAPRYSALSRSIPAWLAAGPADAIWAAAASTPEIAEHRSHRGILCIMTLPKFSLCHALRAAQAEPRCPCQLTFAKIS